MCTVCASAPPPPSVCFAPQKQNKAEWGKYLDGLQRAAGLTKPRGVGWAAATGGGRGRVRVRVRVRVWRRVRMCWRVGGRLCGCACVWDPLWGAETFLLSDALSPAPPRSVHWQSGEAREAKDGTPREFAAAVSEGLVTMQSLVWADGSPRWVAPPRRLF